MIASWFLFPLLLTAMALGWGVLVESASGRKLSLALLPGAGLSAIMVVASLTTATDSTAELTTPIVAGGAIVGLVLGARQRLRIRPDAWILAACAGVFAVYAAPIVLSGEATFAGYIKLDDTATWLALTDRVMEHGRSLDGLAPSTYEATLALNLGDWYPVGAFLPLGVGTEITGVDPAWLIQPYMAWLAALLALPLARLASIAGPPRVQAAVAFVAAQPALLAGYYLWGGIKEIAAATLIAQAAALGACVVEERPTVRSLLPLALSCGAVLGVLTLGGAVWIAPIVVGVGVVSARRHGFAANRRPLLIAAAATALVLAAVLIEGSLVPSASSPLRDEADLGNLFSPLNPLQAFGIWAAADFRTDPGHLWLTYIAVAVAFVSAAYGAWWVRRRSDGLMLLLAAALIGGTALLILGSPWIDGKALATASPFLVLFSLVGGVAMLSGDRRIAGWTALTAVAGGVFLSNALAFSEVNLAPRDQLAELERIGESASGAGPTLMTEFQPFGVRHFLREGDPESVGELRRRTLQLSTGDLVRKGFSADLDQFDAATIAPYRTIVLRRSPSHSRPPAPYELIESGDYYEVWQRPAGGSEVVLAHLPLGPTPAFSPNTTRTRRTATPNCADVFELGRIAAEEGAELVAAPGTQPIEVSLSEADVPEDWEEPPGSVVPSGPGTLSAEFEVERGGRYGIWVGGSTRGEISVSVDGAETATVRHLLNNKGEFVELGDATLGRGPHRLELRYESGLLRAGEGGEASALGPILIGLSADEGGPLVRVPAEEADALCGRPWDWIEVVSAG